MNFKFLKFLLNFFIVILLTILTQTGGLIYLLNSLLFLKKKQVKLHFRVLSFVAFYTIVNLFITPQLAKLNGRVQISETEKIKLANPFYKLLNRNYVKPELNLLLNSVSQDLNETPIQINVLDANFPFWDGFPLIPHLSHNDGKKLDLAFVYENPNGESSNNIKSLSGYGIFEEAKTGEINQVNNCEENGFYQYSIAKFLGLNLFHKDLVFSENGTKLLINSILRQSALEKLFIEPHMKNRLNLNHTKVRYHGCHAVRHDDHIHIQIK